MNYEPRLTTFRPEILLFFGSMWCWLSKNWIGLVQTLAFVIQAVFAVMIWKATCRYTQWTGDLAKLTGELVKYSANQFRASLYEKRLGVFLATMDFLANFMTTVEVTIPDIQKLSRATLETDFLFERDAIDIVGEVRTKALDYRLKSTLLKDQREAHRMNELQTECFVLEQWLIDFAPKTVKNVFSPYLKMSEQEIDAVLGAGK